MSKKKIIALSASILAVVAIVVGGTLAYFTDSAEKTNTFTVGNVKIELTEDKWDEEGSVDGAEAYPGEPLKKDPTVENTGANPCFVRIIVEGLGQFGNKGDITYRTDYETGKLGTDWVLHTDGYFYYTKVLDIGETTDALFDQIVMPIGLTNDDAETEYDVVVTAQAVQAQGAMAKFADVLNMNVGQIAAWFTACGM